MSSVFGINSGKARFTVGGRKIRTPADDREYNLRDRICIPPQPRETCLADIKESVDSRRRFSTPQRSSPFHKTIDTCAYSKVKNIPLELSDDSEEDDITQFTPTPKVGKKRMKRVNEPTASAKRRKLVHETTIKKEILNSPPPLPLPSIPQNENIESNNNDISRSSSMDLTLLNTPMQNPILSSGIPTQCTGTAHKLDSDEELENFNCSRTFSRLSPNTFKSPTSLSSEEYPPSSMDPLLLASGIPRRNEQFPSPEPPASVSQLRRENLSLKQTVQKLLTRLQQSEAKSEESRVKLEQSEAKLELWSHQVQLLTNLLYKHCPDLVTTTERT